MRIYTPSRNDCSLVNQDERLISNFHLYNEGAGGIQFVDSAEDADIIILFEQFSFKLWDYKDALSECLLVRTFPSKVFTVNYDDLGRGYLPGCYTSLTSVNFDPGIHKASSYPRTYNEVAARARAEQSRIPARWLFSFCGTTASHPVRKTILRELSGSEVGRIEYVDQMFHHHTEDQKTSYVDLILDSLFVLCPRGWSPTTYRLFEVMELGRCPVIISDEWVPIEGIDWEDCSIRVRECDIPRIPVILARRRDDAARLGANARKVWDSFFSIENRNKLYLQSIVELYRSSRERAPLLFSDLDSRWSSWGFYWSNGWTIPQRARVKFDNAVRRVAASMIG